MKIFVDIGERIFLVLLSGTFLYRFLPQVSVHPYDLLLVVSELLTVILILVRRQGDCATSPYPILIAFYGTAAPLLVSPHGPSLAPASLTATVMLMGLLLSISAKIYLNRSLGLVAANRGVKRRGPYRVVRHPMYAGYMITQAGFLISTFSTWNLCIYVSAWAAQFLRIIEEEKFLGQDEAYRSYSGNVRSRLIPKIF